MKPISVRVRLHTTKELCDKIACEMDAMGLSPAFAGVIGPVEKYETLARVLGPAYAQREPEYVKVYQEAGDNIVEVGYC